MFFFKRHETDFTRGTSKTKLLLIKKLSRLRTDCATIVTTYKNNLMDKVGDSYGVISPKECALDCKKAGFDALDFNFCDLGRGGQPIAEHDWEEYLVSYKAFCDKNGIAFPQTHLHMYDPVDERVIDHGWERELLKRSVKGSGILETKWSIAHPLHERRPDFTREDYLKLNLEYYRPIVEQAKEMNYGIAFENMLLYAGEEYVYAANAEDLIELVDAFDMPNVGINWDFGHAHISVKNQVAEIRKIGKRLKSLHVADNHSVWDEHLTPYYGNINWDEMMKALADVEYEGNLTYEVQSFSIDLPKELRMSQAIHLVDMGRYLINKVEQAKRL